MYLVKKDDFNALVLAPAVSSVVVHMCSCLPVVEVVIFATCPAVKTIIPKKGQSVAQTYLIMPQLQHTPTVVSAIPKVSVEISQSLRAH